MVFRFWASLSLLVLACACRHNLICSLWAKGQLQIQGAIDESTWIKAETLNGKGSKNEPSVGLNSAYIMLHLSCRATEWIRRKRLCRPRQRRCIRKVPATERFDGSGNPSPTHQKKCTDWTLIFYFKWFHIRVWVGQDLEIHSPCQENATTCPTRWNHQSITPRLPSSRQWWYVVPCEASGKMLRAKLFHITHVWRMRPNQHQICSPFAGLHVHPSKTVKFIRRDKTSNGISDE